MNLNHLERCVEIKSAKAEDASSELPLVSLEAEIPEVLFRGMKEFIGTNPTWDQYRVMTSALTNFLFQNGCVDRVVTECYLNDLFTRSEA